MRPLVLIPALAAVSLVSATAAWACSCIRFDSAADQLESADVLFVGRAVETRTAPMRDSPVGHGPGQSQTRFVVTRTIKGRAQTEQIVFHTTGDGGAACGVEFQPGRTYTIIAGRHEGRLSTSLCQSPQFPLEAYEQALGERG